MPEGPGMTWAAGPIPPRRPVSAANAAAGQEMYEAWKAWMEAEAVRDQRKARFDRMKADNPLAHLFMQFALVRREASWSVE